MVTDGQSEMQEVIVNKDIDKYMSKSKILS